MYDGQNKWRSAGCAGRINYRGSLGKLRSAGENGIGGAQRRTSGSRYFWSATHPRRRSNRDHQNGGRRVRQERRRHLVRGVAFWWGEAPERLPVSPEETDGYTINVTR